MLVGAPTLTLEPLSLPGAPDVDAAVFELMCADKGNKRFFTFRVVYIPPQIYRLQIHAPILHFRTMYYYVIYKNFILIGNLNIYSASLEIQCYYEFFVTVCEFRQYNEITNSSNRIVDETYQTRECAIFDHLVPPDPYHPPLSVYCTKVKNINRQHRKPLPCF